MIAKSITEIAGSMMPHRLIDIIRSKVTASTEVTISAARAPSSAGSSLR